MDINRFPIPTLWGIVVKRRLSPALRRGNRRIAPPLQGNGRFAATDSISVVLAWTSVAILMVIVPAFRGR
jgi:hypothetical protein